MSTVSAPYGLKPISLIGGQSFTGGTIREYLLTTNNTAPIYTGDLVQLGASVAGQPTVVTSTPTTSTAGSYNTSYISGSGQYYASTITDSGLLIDAISDDLLSPKSSRVSQFIQGLFKAGK